MNNRPVLALSFFVGNTVVLQLFRPARASNQRGVASLTVSAPFRDSKLDGECFRNGESFRHFEMGNSPFADVGFFLQIDRFVGFLLFSVLLSSTTHAAERTLVSRSFSPIAGLFELHGNRDTVDVFLRVLALTFSVF